MARKYLFTLNIINAVIFVIILFIFGSVFIFDYVITNPDGKFVFTEVIFQLKNVISYSLFFFLYFIAIAIAMAIATLFSQLPEFNSGFMYNFINEFFRNYLGLWFSFPEGETPGLWDVPDLIMRSLLLFLNNLYLFSFQLCYLIAIIYFVRAIFQNNPKFNIIAIGSLVLMIVIPLMVFGLRDMLLLFNVSPSELDDLVNPLAGKLTSMPINDFFLFIASPVALLAIMCYIYLEVAFQINYTDLVTRPSLERSDRLNKQIKILHKESILVTTDIDKIKEEATKRREEIEKEKEKLGKFFAKTSQRFSYVKEMIEKRKLEEEEKKLITAASKTRRLGRYIERLFKEDTEAENTLTAKSSAPRAKNLAISTAINFSFRLSMLIIISYIIIHPGWIFVHVFNLPPAITESMAMFSPELIIIILVPMMLIFPMIAQIISYIKHRSLIIRLKQEGHIKEILASVGDYVKVEGDEGGMGEGSTETPEVATESA